MKAVLAPFPNDNTDPHPSWLEDRNAIWMIAEQHSPMPDELMNALIGRISVIEARIQATPATTPTGVLAKAVAALQAVPEGFEPDERGVASVLREAEALFSIGYGDAPQEAAWREVVHRFIEARTAENAYEAEHIAPLIPDDLPIGPKRSAACERVAPEHWDAWERLSEPRYAAEDQLLDKPAHSVAAFAMKVLLCRGEGRDQNGYDSMLEREALAILADNGISIPTRARA